MNHRAVVLVLFACMVVVELCAMAAMMPFGNFSQPEVAVRFVFLGVVAGGSYLVAVYCFGAVAPSWRKAVFWGLALLLRVAVFAIEPADDIWRYLWEGMIQIEGFSPYLLAPDAVELVAVRPEWWTQINHPGWTTIYPPGAELMFAAMARISPSVWFFKLVFALADLGTVFFVLRLHTGSRRYRDTAWYAWNPLVVYVFAGGGHFDSVMIALMTAAIWALHRANPLDRGPFAWNWSLLSGGLLGAAISIKIVPVLLVPLWLMTLGRRWVAVLPGLAVPLVLACLYGFPEVKVFDSLGKFAEVARTNEVVWWIIDWMGAPHPEVLNTIANVLIVFLAGAFALVFARNWRRGTLWVLGAALLLSPVLHAWYLPWILPVAAWRRSYPWFVFSVSMFVYFLLWVPGLSGVAWTPTPLYRVALLLPPVLAIVALRGYWKLHSRREPQNI